MEFTPKILEKTWDHRLEKKVMEKWSGSEVYKFDPNKPKIFVMDTPPPYPSGRPWHIGAAAHYSQIDMIARAHRMLGYSVMFPVGIDRNGIAVETYTEKKFGISIHNTPRDRFIEWCRKALDELEAEMLAIMRNLGLSCDFDNYYRTDSEEYRALTQKTFIELFRRGMILEDTRPNNYCTKCGTTIADAEVVYEDLPAQLVYMRFKVKEGGEIIVASTRPELLGACQAVIVNPEDKRNAQFAGKTAVIPIYGREVKIVAHSQANPDFGSGAAMICSYGDFTDVRLFREMKLKEIVMLDMRGKLSEAAGDYSGFSVAQAREKIIADMEVKGIVVKKESITHRTPVCERSKTPIEIVPMKELYLRQIDFIDKMRNFGSSMKFYPNSARQLLLDWIDSVSIDWPISRRRFYATEIPIWYCKSCGTPHLPEPGKYVRPWKDSAPFEKCGKCGGKEFVGEERTFDTWMDSSITSLMISKYGKDEEFFKKVYPNSIRVQGKDIVRTWLYYSMLRCYQVTGQPPWGSAWVMGYVVDEKGKKMSKSKGNVVDPMPVLETYGSDNFRFWSASEASLGSDYRFSEQKLQGSGKFLTKLWNISRFISSFPQPNKAVLTETDKWIVSELARLIIDCKLAYSEHDFFRASSRIREFVWDIFADHYIEMVKPRAYGSGFTEEEKEAAWYTLHFCLRACLQILAPITPFITDFVYDKLYAKSGESIHSTQFPSAKLRLQEGQERPEEVTRQIKEFNSRIWNEKKASGLSLKEGIRMQLPDNLKKFEKDLTAMHMLQ
jgi:valyl-tRNA synthetase